MGWKRQIDTPHGLIQSVLFHFASSFLLPRYGAEVAEQELGVQSSSSLLHDALNVREVRVVLQGTLHQTGLRVRESAWGMRRRKRGGSMEISIVAGEEMRSNAHCTELH